MVDIGEESEPFVVEPIVEPVPGKKSQPAPVHDPIPEFVPEPERVPA